MATQSPRFHSQGNEEEEQLTKTPDELRKTMKKYTGTLWETVETNILLTRLGGGGLCTDTDEIGSSCATASPGKENQNLKQKQETALTAHQNKSSRLCPGRLMGGHMTPSLVLRVPVSVIVEVSGSGRPPRLMQSPQHSTSP